MPQDTPRPGEGAFIRAELRPAVAPESGQFAPLETGASPEEIRKRLAENSFN